MKTKVEALELNQTWAIVDLPPNIKPIRCKWVYKIKRLLDGSVKHYKACFVAKGYAQTERIDYFDTFSPMVKMTIVKMLLALALIKQ